MTEEEVKYYSVSQYNKAIKNYFDRIDELQDVHIKGEISNYRGATNGHLYFTIKDETSRISVVMFKGAVSTLNFEPKDGDEVLIDGRIGVYEPSGAYQVYINRMNLAGNGDLLKKLEELKKKLAAEGLFDEAHKKTIPKFPERIGIVTAPNKAAVKDLLSTLARRYPLCETIIFPAIVQGDQAKESIVKQIKEANDPKYKIDTLIVGRGGGSIEDLWAFNEEIVARAIYDSRVPIISAVGHEIDVTIADFVADKRAITPTAAAEIATPNLPDLLNTISQYKIRLNNNITGNLNYYKDMLKKLSTSYVLSNPLATFEIRQQKLDELTIRLNSNIIHKLDVSKNKFESIKTSRVLLHPEDILVKYNNSMELVINKLELLNPLNVLKKGYSVTKVNDKPLKTIKDVKKNDKLNIKIIDGEIDAVVEGVK